MSLRIKYLLATAGSVLVPLLAYLLLDTLLMRSILLEQQTEPLREVADLIHSSLYCCEKDCKTDARELLRAEHLSTIGQLAAGLAHELRNPLFIVRASAEKWARKIPEAGELAADIIEEVDRVEAIIAGLLDLGRPLDLDEKPVDLRRVLDDVADQVARAQPAGKTIEWKDDRVEGRVLRGLPHPRRLRHAAPGVFQHRLQRLRRDREPGRGPGAGRARRQRQGAGRDPGHGRGHRGRGPAAGVQAVLHPQGHGLRHPGGGPATRLRLAGKKSAWNHRPKLYPG